MKILELGKYRRARVWIGELPDISYSFVEKSTFTVTADNKITGSEVRQAAVEVFVPLGPRSMYGLLGGQWNPEKTGRLIVEVHISSANGPMLLDNIASKSDEVHMGLPAEYANAVSAGVDFATSELGSLGSGSLSINCAAHGVVGSCDIIYKHLTTVLIKLFNINAHEASDEELIKLFPSRFS